MRRRCVSKRFYFKTFKILLRDLSVLNRRLKLGSYLTSYTALFYAFYQPIPKRRTRGTNISSLIHISSNFHEIITIFLLPRVLPLIERYYSLSPHFTFVYNFTSYFFSFYNILFTRLSSLVTCIWSLLEKNVFFFHFAYA